MPHKLAAFDTYIWLLLCRDGPTFAVKKMTEKGREGEKQTGGMAPKMVSLEGPPKGKREPNFSSWIWGKKKEVLIVVFKNSLQITFYFMHYNKENRWKN